ncbi:translocon at the outer membrane of chloroplasts 64-like [Glycine max]|uniref:translocon at the outer membrane of chloroplasts 64-like n=1 Tax=Glycine max TaxID=3847 RepID=UPI001B355505|nr:translocon at the outer membrane of chloroplasts 64-like [Glycine max]
MSIFHLDNIGQVLKHINLGDYLSSRVPSLKRCSGQKPNGEVKASSLKLLAHIMQFLQRHEFRLKHDDWMNTVKPNLHPGVSAQLHEKFEVFDVEIENSKSVRSEMRAVINSLLKLVSELGLSTRDTSPLRVMVGNGQQLECTRVCEDVSVVIQSTQFTVDLHVLPIASANVVLGVQWLKSLGPVLTDYNTLCMKHCYAIMVTLLAK